MVCSTKRRNPLAVLGENLEDLLRAHVLVDDLLHKTLLQNPATSDANAATAPPQHHPGTHFGAPVSGHATATSSGQQLPEECHPPSDTLPYQTLAASDLHQPRLPQWSGHDWLLSTRAHDKRDSHRGGVVVVRSKCNRSVFVDTTARMHLIMEVMWMWT